MHAIENVVSVTVQLVSNLAISNYLAKITNVPQDVIHQDATLATKQKKYHAIADIPDFLFLVEWNAQPNHQDAGTNAKHQQIVTMYQELRILVISALVQDVDKCVIGH